MNIEEIFHSGDSSESSFSTGGDDNEPSGVCCLSTCAQESLPCSCAASPGQTNLPFSSNEGSNFSQRYQFLKNVARRPETKPFQLPSRRQSFKPKVKSSPDEPLCYQTVYNLSYKCSHDPNSLSMPACWWIKTIFLSTLKASSSLLDFKSENSVWLTQSSQLSRLCESSNGHNRKVESGNWAFVPVRFDYWAQMVSASMHSRRKLSTISRNFLRLSRRPILRAIYLKSIYESSRA